MHCELCAKANSVVRSVFPPLLVRKQPEPAAVAMMAHRALAGDVAAMRKSDSAPALRDMVQDDGALFFFASLS